MGENGTETATQTEMWEAEKVDALFGKVTVLPDPMQGQGSTEVQQPVEQPCSSS
jgi:hypothetical protein